MSEGFLSRLRNKTRKAEPAKGEPRPFITDRTKSWRERETRPNFLETLDKIEQYGWQTWSVATDDEDSPNFSYTAGVFDTLGFPELITVGLNPNVGGSTLNRAAALMRKGESLIDRRVPDLLGPGIEVEFHPVDPKWLHRVMLRTNWYYEGAEVPALQLIFPDLENRFQWEEGFNSMFQQPMLAPGYPEQDLEHEFWDSHDLTLDKSAWKFPVPPQRKVMTTEAVESQAEPVTYVTHFEEDGAWMFLSDSMTGSPCIPSRLRRIVAADPSLEAIADLPLGWVATREAPGKPWERFEDEQEDDVTG